MKKLYSRNFFIANLVLVGVLVGFGVALLPYSCDGSGSYRENARAESPSERPAAAATAIDQARAVQDAFRYVAEKVLPTVVELAVVEKPAVSSDPASPWEFFFGTPDGDPGSPREFERKGVGSGVIVRRDGNTYYILTNNHVAGNAESITVILSDKREFPGSLVGADPRKDLALVKIEVPGARLAVATLGDSDRLRVGDWAIAVGNPLGLASSMTAGIVSALGRDGGPDGNISDFIQTDAAINRGNSGGALVDINGDVVGINTWIATPTGGNIGLGFAIPINNAKKAIEDFIKVGSVEYGWIGVQLSPLGKEESRELGLEGRKGAFVESVYIDGPAYKGGILPGDFIVEVNGKTVEGLEQLVRLVGDLPVGNVAKIKLLRDGDAKKILERAVTIEKRVEAETSASAKLWPGLQALSLKNPDLRKGVVPAGVSGCLVANVMPKSPAATMELRPGDVIVAVNERKIASLLDFYRLLNDPATKKVSFTVLRDGHELSTLAYVRK